VGREKPLAEADGVLDEGDPQDRLQADQEEGRRRARRADAQPEGESDGAGAAE